MYSTVKVIFMGLLIALTVHVHVYWYVHPELSAMQMFKWLIGLGR